MKVDFAANINMYKKNAVETPGKTDQSVDARGRTDVVEISTGTAGKPGKDMAAVRSSVLREVSYPADAARIQELHQRVKDGTYLVSTNDLVDAILEA